MERLFDGHEQIGFHVAAARRLLRAGARAEATKRVCGIARLAAARASAEELLEEIAEAGSAEMHAAIAQAAGHSTPAANSATGGPLLEAAPFPIGAEFIVFLPLAGIAQNLVSLIDFLEFGLGGLFILGHIGMIFSRQFPEGFADFILGSRLRDSERLIVILVLHWDTFSVEIFTQAQAQACRGQRK